METVVGLFRSWEEADRTVKALEEAGFSDAVSVLAREAVVKEPLEEAETEFTARTKAEQARQEGSLGESAGAGALGGSIVGGLTGLLIGIGAIAIPGIGPVLAAGTIASALAGTAAGAAAGATAGGLLGALAGLNLGEAETHFYAEGIRRGGILVVVHAREGQGDTARTIMNNAGAVDMDSTSAEWRGSGWDRFDESRDPENFPGAWGRITDNR